MTYGPHGQDCLAGSTLSLINRMTVILLTPSFAAASRKIQFASFGTLAFTIDRYSPFGSEVADPELGP